MDFNPAFSSSDVDFSCTLSENTGSERYSSSPLKSYKRMDILPVTETRLKRSFLNPNSKGFVPSQRTPSVNSSKYRSESPSSLSDRYFEDTVKHCELNPLVKCFVEVGANQCPWAKRHDFEKGGHVWGKIFILIFG